MKRKLINIGWLIIILILIRTVVTAQKIKNDFETRTAVSLSFKPIKKLKLSFIPEMRFDENFSLDKYLFEGEAECKVTKFLDVAATYRFVVNPRDTKDTEYFNRYGFSATAKKEFGNFEPSFRLRYSNYADDEITDKSFMRYKASLKYDIPDCKLTPFIAAELFQQTDGGNLYKMRYSSGFDYKLFKKNYIGVSYKFDYYNTDYLNKHIISLGYKMKF